MKNLSGFKLLIRGFG